MPDKASEGEVLDWKQETEEAPETFTVLKRFKLGRRFLTDARAMRNWRERIHNYPNPVLIIHGTADRLVPFAMGEALYEACRAPHKKLLAVEGADHVRSYLREPERYEACVSTFLEESGFFQ